jgi:phage I-like protein
LLAITIRAWPKIFKLTHYRWLRPLTPRPHNGHVSEKRTPNQLQIGTITALTGHAAFGFPGVEDGKARVAPTEFRVFPAGKFSTTKGDYFFTPRSAKSVMELYASRGNPLKGDYEHQTDAVAMGFPPIEAPASIIEMVPEVRMDAAGAPELWVTGVKWTDRARGMLESGEYAMFSPVFPYDKETREVLGLLRIALTNDPAMNFLEPLVAATAGTITEENPMADQVTCAKCTATDAHLATLKAANEKLLADHEKLVGDHQQLLGNHQALTAQLKSFEEWAAEEAEEHEDGESTLTATLTASNGGKKPETRVVIAALSRSFKRLREERTKIVALTGKPDGVIGTVTAWAEQSKELVALKAQQKQTEIATLTAQYKQKADAAVAGRLMTPAKRKDCDEFLAKYGVDQAMAMLSVFVPDGATPLVNGIESPTQQLSPNLLTAVATLTAGELEEASKMGISVEVLAASKAATQKMMEDRRRQASGR